MSYETWALVRPVIGCSFAAGAVSGVVIFLAFLRIREDVRDGKARNLIDWLNRRLGRTGYVGKHRKTPAW